MILPRLKTVKDLEPYLIDLCLSVRSGSADRVWIAACISLFSLPSWQTLLVNTSTISLVCLSQASCRETASVPLGPLL